MLRFITGPYTSAERMLPRPEEAILRRIEALKHPLSIIPTNCHGALPSWTDVEQRIYAGLNQKFKRQFFKQTTLADRIKLCSNEGIVKREIEQFCNQINEVIATCGCTTKNASKAAKYREHGNELYCANPPQVSRSIEMYNLAILYAPEMPSTDGSTTTREAALAYGNRSAAFSRLRQHYHAVYDIKVAQSLGYSQFKCQDKLLIRKCESLIYIGRFQESIDVQYREFRFDQRQLQQTKWGDLSKMRNFFIDNAYTLIPDPKPEKAFYMNNDASFVQMFTDQGRYMPQANQPTLSKKVALAHDPKQIGRHLVATEDIEFGDILAVIKPYSTVADKKHEHLYCHFCLVQLAFDTNSVEFEQTRCVPCYACTSVLYCSEVCRYQAWDAFHRLECKLLPILYQTDKWAHLALRTWFLTFHKTHEELKKYIEQKQQLSHEEIIYPFENMDCTAVSRMSFNEAGRDKEDLLKKTITACLLTHLVKMTNFLQEYDLTTEYESICCELLLKHLLQIQANPSDLEKDFIFHDDQHANDQFHFAAVAPLTGLVNHCCSPNVLLSPIKLPHSKILTNLRALFAIKPIKAGSEIVLNYAIDAIPQVEMPVDQRKNILQTRFGFTCHCAKCTLEERDNPFGAVPSKSKEFIEYQQIGCSKCGELMVKDTSKSGNVAITFRCSANCGAENMNLRQMKSAYKMVKSLQKEAKLLVESIKDMISQEPEGMFPLLCQLEALATDRMPRVAYKNSWTLSCLNLELGRFYTAYACTSSEDFATDLRKAFQFSEKHLRLFEETEGDNSANVHTVLDYMVRHYDLLFKSPTFLEHMNELNPRRMQLIMNGKPVPYDDGKDMIDKIEIFKDRLEKARQLSVR